jgi:hypothetical protein
VVKKNSFHAFARRWHRRLSVIIGIQLFLWTLSGLIFAWLPIEEVRGETLLTEGAPQLRVTDSPSTMLAMTEAEAIQAARLALREPADPITAEFIHDAPNEYRGGSLPAWKIDFADATTLYLDPVTAKVHAVRSTKWRIFDFFWMLHIMDYDERDDFNSPLLIIAAAFGVLTSASGLALAVVLYRSRLAKFQRL